MYAPDVAIGPGPEYCLLPRGRSLGANAFGRAPEKNLWGLGTRQSWGNIIRAFINSLQLLNHQKPLKPMLIKGALWNNFFQLWCPMSLAAGPGSPLRMGLLVPQQFSGAVSYLQDVKLAQPFLSWGYLGVCTSRHLNSSYKNKLYVGISLVAPCCHHTFLLCVCKLPRQKT